MKNKNAAETNSLTSHRIFISYGREDAEDLAFQLEKDLAEKEQVNDSFG